VVLTLTVACSGFAILLSACEELAIFLHEPGVMTIMV